MIETLAADVEILMGEMRHHALGQACDEQPLPELDFEAVDFGAASEPFAAVRKLKLGDLATLRLLTRPPSRLPSLSLIATPSVARWPLAARRWRFRAVLARAS